MSARDSRRCISASLDTRAVEPLPLEGFADDDVVSVDQHGLGVFRPKKKRGADGYIVAYCAGVIDSDGTIGIKRNTYKVRVVGDSTEPTYSARICVRQVSREALEALQSVFGGQIRLAKTYAKHGRPIWSWEIRDALAEHALKALRHHLRIKRQQAENCLSLRDLIARSKIARMARGRGHVGAAVRPLHISTQMAALFERARALNRVGAP
jgi:hypothetical protein